ncbi:MAG: hypothetical protein R2845_09060 [Thermomicrobiales bacterium]
MVRDEAFSAFGAEESRRINVRAVRDVLELLDEGRIVAMFPQAYPVIDNNPRPATLPGGELPFASASRRSCAWHVDPALPLPSFRSVSRTSDRHPDAGKSPPASAHRSAIPRWNPPNSWT